MSVEQPSRRLAAILVADIAGYSALMGADEAGTVAALKGHQAVILPMIAAQGGRVIDTAGDGVLAEFGSVVAAVNCAIKLQATMAERNREIAPGKRMEFRIGINQGEIVYDEARIYGDGINVASRLQALAEPGGILVSGKVFEEVRDRVDAGFRDLGEKALKNIARPVRAFAVGGVAGLPEDAPSAPVLPSLAVLPFENLSGDAEQEYFADGVVEDVITALSRFKSFAVIARNSSFVYKGRTVDLREIAKALGVRYVLDGSVRRAGERLRITAQLIDGVDGRQLWAEKYDGALTELFDFQDQITERVAFIVEPQIRRAEIERTRRKRPESLDAYDLYLQSMAKHFIAEPETNAEAFALIRRALALEPNYGTALAAAAWHLEYRISMGWPDLTGDDRQECLRLTRLALANANGDATILAHVGITLASVGHEYERGMQIMRLAVETNPNGVFVATAAGVLLLHCGSIEESLAMSHRALKMSPGDPSSHWPLTAVAHAHMILGDYQEALRWAERSQAVNPHFNATYWMLIAANALLQRMTEARRWLAAFRSIAPTVTVQAIMAGQPAMDPSRNAAIYEGLRLAGLPEETSKAAPLPSLAVLPFENMSGDAEQEYFADGVVEDIITALSRFKSFAVIARNSSFVYKGRAVDVRTVGKELGVRYVLEGSVRKSGARLRISAQLVDGETGAHIWAQNFDGGIEEVFDFQDRITESVVGIAEPQVQQAELARAQRERPGSVAAYDLYLRSLPSFYITAEPDNRSAYALLKQAIAIEPDNAIYLALAAETVQHRYGMGWPPLGPDDEAACFDLTNRALSNAGDDAVVLSFCGNALIQRFRDYDRGVAIIKRAVELNPNNFVVAGHSGVAALHCGSLDDAIAHFERCRRLNPLVSGAFFSSTGIAHAHMAMGKYAEAIEWARKALAINPKFDPIYWILAAAYALLGRPDEARRYREELQKLSPKSTVASIRDGQPAKIPERMEAILDGLRLAGLPEA